MSNKKPETKDIVVRRDIWERVKIEATKQEKSILELASELLENGLAKDGVSG